VSAFSGKPIFGQIGPIINNNFFNKLIINKLIINIIATNYMRGNLIYLQNTKHISNNSSYSLFVYSLLVKIFVYLNNPQITKAQINYIKYYFNIIIYNINFSLNYILKHASRNLRGHTFVSNLKLTKNRNSHETFNDKNAYNLNNIKNSLLPEFDKFSE
jgi:hypothetical protein